MEQFREAMPIPLPSIIEGMPNDVYHGHESISKSGLDLVARSPAHYRFRQASEPTRAMEIGTAIHTAILEPARFDAEYVLLKDVKDRRASEYKQAVAAHGTERVLVATEADNVIGMRESVLSNPRVTQWLASGGAAELSLFALDPVTGVTVRIRPDFLTTSNSIIDLKSTVDARMHSFSKAILNYNYHMQAAFYMDVFKWATGETADSFRFIAVEKELPHASMVYRLDDTAIAEGRKLYRQALDTYAKCLEADQWPAYESGEDDLISLPDWEIRRIENELEVNLGE
jgi:exodeoxyribonuclease VIII